MITKLAYFSSSTSWGGLEMNILRYAKWMRDRGHLVVVIGVDNSRLIIEAEALKLPTILVQKQKKYYDFKKAARLADLSHTWPVRGHQHLPSGRRADDLPAGLCA